MKRVWWVSNRDGNSSVTTPSAIEQDVVPSTKLQLL